MLLMVQNNHLPFKMFNMPNFPNNHLFLLVATMIVTRKIRHNGRRRKYHNTSFISFLYKHIPIYLVYSDKACKLTSISYNYVQYSRNEFLDLFHMVGLWTD